MTRMADVEHTNPYTGETFSATFRRGVVVADGGEPGAGPPDEEAGETVSAAAMTDVAHEAPTEGAVRSFERGTEGRGERV
ncbi:MAG: hypothetical protein V5A43_00950 [Haloarculaceae archaeon]